MLAMGTAATALVGFRAKSVSGEGKRVIVLGAGVAGLSAAKFLKAEGFEVVVVEARQRIGGRIFTQYDMGTPVEWGAGFFQTNLNPFQEILKQHNLGYKPILGSSFRVFGGASLPVEGELWEEGRSWESKFWKRYRKIVDRLPDNGDLPVSEVLRMTLAEFPQDEALTDYWTWRQLEERILLGTDLNLSSSKWNRSPDLLPEGQMISAGMSKVLEKFAQGLDIRLGQRAILVKDTGGKVTVLTTEDTYEGDFVVVTLPVGVLQKGDLRFEPDASHAKRVAWQKIQMSNLEKVVLRYEKVAWARDVASFGFIGNAGQMSFPRVINLAHFNGRPIVVATVIGAVSSGHTIQDMASELHARMKAVSKGLAEPVEVATTSWSEDRYSRGGASFIPLGNDIESRDFLARPEGKVYFAGEATMRQGAGTVQGAFQSGIRAANWIVEKCR